MDRARALSGLQQPAEVTLLLEVTARALAACLVQPDRQRWAAILPRELRELFLRTPHDAAQRAADVYAAVTKVEGVRAQFGIEHAQAAIRALASDLPADDARLLASHLSSELAELLLGPGAPSRFGRPEPAGAPHAAHERPAGAVASAAPGSTHPVSEAPPQGAQGGSVGAWEEGRTDHTLGSGTAPGAADSLATGSPGSQRGLSDTKR